jgi:hypothetical protein
MLNKINCKDFVINSMNNNNDNDSNSKEILNIFFNNFDSHMYLLFQIIIIINI